MCKALPLGRAFFINGRDNRKGGGLGNFGCLRSLVNFVICELFCNFVAYYVYIGVQLLRYTIKRFKWHT